jgi:exopolysaccharide biosynthesis polyprenyl glycosylphosphotransferase
VNPAGLRQDLPGLATPIVVTRDTEVADVTAIRGGRTTHPVPVADLNPPVTTTVRTRSRRRRRAAWLTSQARWLMVADGLVALVAAFLALVLRFGHHLGTSTNGLYIVVTLVVPLVWVGTLYLGRCYEHRFLGEGSDEFGRVFESAVRMFATLAVVLFATNWDLARGYAVIVLPLVTVGSLLVHLVGRSLLRRAEKRGVANQRVLIIGTERATAEMVRNLDRAEASFEIVGALVDRCSSELIEGVPVVGSSADAGDVVSRLDVDAVAVAAWSTFSQQELRKFAWELEGSDIDVLVTPNLTDVSGPRISVRPVGGLPLLHVEQPEFTGVRRILKGAFDRGLALLALLVLSPVFVAIAVAVRLDSAGPALFRQTRVGRGGREFSMLKFRSMTVDAEDRLLDIREENVHQQGPLFKVQHDPRVTRVGAFLRRTSLDELPQLWNVVRGTMSLVGPRPPLPREVETYEDDVQRRLLVKPGLTGLWQISGRSDLSWEDSVRLDLYYVENWNLFLDLSILLRTVRAVVAARGAY